MITLLNLIINRDKIKETYLSTNDTEFKTLFNSSDWYRLNKKAIFIIGNDSYVVEDLEDNHIYPLPDACIGTEFTLFITGESANSYKATEKLLVRVMGGGSSGNNGTSTGLTTEQMNNILNDTYTGRDLTEVFADEIVNYDNEWEWIKARIQAGNYDNLYVGDYISISLSNEKADVLDMQIAGIDVCPEVNQRKHHYVDFISRNCCSEPIIWSSNNNNGNSKNKNPFQASDLYEWITNTLYGYLPNKVKNVICEKEIVVEYRYSDSETLTDSNRGYFERFPNLWLPTEYEVFGNIINGTQKSDVGFAEQYPLFKSGRKRFKEYLGNGPFGPAMMPTAWWLATAASGSSDEACISSDGMPRTLSITLEKPVPVCFRVG